MSRVRVCRKPNCNKLISFEQSNPYCSEHAGLYHKRNPFAKQQRKQNYSMYNKYKRDKEANAFYHSKQWRTVSNHIKREAYFTCQCCGHTYDKTGYLVVDHIIPRRVDKRKQSDEDNLWVLCKRCHYWKGELENRIYQSQSLVVNMDTSKKWDRGKMTEWILKHEHK
ncbi:hypothetical protein FC19_GL001449 [Liquorilactobacillus aquaticus DSM 21051]|uniref:HNH nuclease domain-containing protein n=1 Tax=Liquorilactobacillus aquaticus DSM 21051 TaxID=1423725 RepID=A0A0R2CWJ9_9LACO|nr:HNH endonuclease signature motif containing protein [Liquorilactobacillus aquaticus]KRM95968.1 hypothetical protein FC19_GL001449 [Liquorilactobacillus aquaticus DSM 21051]